MTANDPAEWIAFADADLHVLDELLNSVRPSWPHICYLAQQTAEKMLKAYLVARDAVPPRTHDLNRLLTASSAFRTDAGSLEVDARLLTRYSTVTRYAGDSPLPQQEDAHTAHKAALRIRSAVAAWIAEERPEPS